MKRHTQRERAIGRDLLCGVSHRAMHMSPVKINFLIRGIEGSSYSSVVRATN